MEKRILTCIVCPRGCTLDVTLDGGRVIKVEGNACRRGETYANDECQSPKRTVTTTMRCEGGAVIPVKTERAIPKELVFSAMKEINAVLAPNAVRVGDVLLKNVAGTGVDVIATDCKQ